MSPGWVYASLPSSWMAVLLPMKVLDIFRPRGGWWDVADSGPDVVRDLFHEVAAVLVLDVQHLFVDFLHQHAATEHGGHRWVAWIAGRYHILGIEHLPGKL